MQQGTLVEWNECEDQTKANNVRSGILHKVIAGSRNFYEELDSGAVLRRDYLIRMSFFVSVNPEGGDPPSIRSLQKYVPEESARPSKSTS